MVINLSKNKLIALILIIIAYSSFYIVRLNFSFSVPYFIKEYSYTKVQIGLAFTVFSVVYGLGKLISGMLSDVFHRKNFLVIGLFCSAVINLFIPSSTNLEFLIILLVINAVFQSFGWPACVKIINTVFAKNEIGTVWGICNASHAIGSSLVALSVGFILKNFDWHYLFYIPSFFSIAMCMIIFQNTKFLKAKKEQTEKINFTKYRTILSKNIFNNSFIWYMSFSTLSLYMVRVTFLNWFPYYLIESCNYSPEAAALEFTGFEVFGILGGFCTGYIADKFREENKIGLGFIISLLLCISVCSSTILVNHTLIFSLTVFLIGFFVYAIQVISGLIANDSVERESTSVATGLLGAFAYIGASLSGILVGYLVDHYGWNSMFIFIFISSILCCTFFFIATMQTNKSYNNNIIYNK